MNGAAILAMVAWLGWLWSVKWIWGTPPSGWPLVFLSMLLGYFCISLVTSYARVKTKALRTIGVVSSLMALCVLAASQIGHGGGGFYILVVYLFAWWSMYAYLPGKQAAGTAGDGGGAGWL
jgi:hypothetical protein